MTYETANKYANQIVDQLTPMCDKIAIAGSIRRRRHQCGDIDIVLMPKPGKQRDIRARCLQSRPAVECDGDDNLRFVLRGGIQVDIYYVTPPAPDMFNKNPTPWGTRLLCRTGSKQFNIWLASQAAQNGMHWNPYWGIYRSGINVAAETEEEIFEALKIPFINPEHRER